MTHLRKLILGTVAALMLTAVPAAANETFNYSCNIVGHLQVDTTKNVLFWRGKKYASPSSRSVQNMAGMPLAMVLPLTSASPPRALLQLINRDKAIACAINFRLSEALNLLVG